MIVDSSALQEQVVTEVIASAFNSAGQRCSSLRVLFLQSDIAGPVLEMLIEAMSELEVGNPFSLTTDIGPVIDSQAKNTLLEHLQKMQDVGEIG